MGLHSIEALLAEDHESLGELIAELCTALELSEGEQSFALLDLVWARLAVHIRAEHLCLFPAVLGAAELISSAGGGVSQLAEAQRLIGELKRDHDVFMHELGRAVQTMREVLSTKEPRSREGRLSGVHETVVAIRERLQEHNRIEELYLYRWPATLLDSAQQSEMVDRIRRELDKMPTRFASRQEA